LDEHRPHPFIIKLCGGATALDLLDGTSFAASPGFRGIFRATERDTVEGLQAQWSPDGQSVVIAAQFDTDSIMQAIVTTHLFQVPVTGGEPVALTKIGECYSEPQFTRGGDGLYAIRKRWATDQVFTRLARLSWPSPSGATVLTGQWERVIEGNTLSPDGRTIYLGAADDGLQRIFQMPASGGCPSR
jgi:hypothetical protein